MAKRRKQLSTTVLYDKPGEQAKKQAAGMLKLPTV
jgi:hypothetical protein